MSTKVETLTSHEIQLIHKMRGNPFYRVMVQRVINEYEGPVEKSKPAKATEPSETSEAPADSGEGAKET
jgi:hypothetical protein